MRREADAPVWQPETLQLFLKRTAGLVWWVPEPGGEIKGPRGLGRVREEENENDYGDRATTLQGGHGHSETVRHGTYQKMKGRKKERCRR